MCRTWPTRRLGSCACTPIAGALPGRRGLCARRSHPGAAGRPWHLAAADGACPSPPLLRRLRGAAVGCFACPLRCSVGEPAEGRGGRWFRTGRHERTPSRERDDFSVAVF